VNHVLPFYDKNTNRTSINASETDSLDFMADATVPGKNAVYK